MSEQVVKFQMTHSRGRVVRLVLLVPTLLLAACMDDVDPSPPPQPQAPIVEVVTVTAKTIPDEPEFIGQTEAFRPVEIRSQVTGIIKKVVFAEGRNIKEGDRLYLIDPVPFKAALLSAKATVAQAHARLVQARQDLARVKPLLAWDGMAGTAGSVSHAVVGNWLQRPRWNRLGQRS